MQMDDILDPFVISKEELMNSVIVQSKNKAELVLSKLPFEYRDEKATELDNLIDNWATKNNWGKVPVNTAVLNTKLWHPPCDDAHSHIFMRKNRTEIIRDHLVLEDNRELKSFTQSLSTSRTDQLGLARIYALISLVEFNGNSTNNAIAAINECDLIIYQLEEKRNSGQTKGGKERTKTVRQQRDKIKAEVIEIAKKLASRNTPKREMTGKISNLIKGKRSKNWIRDILKEKKFL